MDERELMRLCADTYFTYDDQGRMLSINDPERRPAPRLVLGRTLAGTVVRYGVTLPDALVRRLQKIIDRQSPVWDLAAPLAALPALREALAEHAPITAETGGPVYRFPMPIAPSSEAVQVTGANRALARATYPWLYDELALWQPCFSVVRDGAVVSICFSSRLTSKAAAAGVDTLPAFRGRGFAAAATAAWGAAVQASGRIPLYSTSWDNLASQGVARRVGLSMFGADATWA